jgi:Arc/MetJ-type ribon-helix-helix transcriptional regulator
MAAQVTVRIPVDLEEALDAAARGGGLKRSDVVRAALRSYLQVGSGQTPTRPIDMVRDLIGKAAGGAAGGDDRRALVERIRRHAVRPA